MENFIDQMWVALMSAFVVLGFVVVMACAIWLEKIAAEKLPTPLYKNSFYD
jgi:hypothetical protein